jgi:hypothetical protein
MGLIYLENRKLFEEDPSITFMPVLKLTAVMLVSLPVCMIALRFALQRSLGAVAIVAVTCELALIAESFFVFGLRDAWTEFAGKMRGRVRPAQG